RYEPRDGGELREASVEPPYDVAEQPAEVPVGDDADGEPADVAQERDADALLLEERQVWVDLHHPRSGEVEGNARPGDVGDDEVVYPGRSDEPGGRFHDGTAGPVRRARDAGCRGSCRSAHT